MDSNIIPFGKYKDKPLEILATDKEYLDWLLAQDWFINNHKNLYTVIINNFQTPQDTPEHNKIQGLFLDEDYCIRFAKFLEPDTFRDEVVITRKTQNGKHTTKYDTITNIRISELQFEKKGIDVSLSLFIHWENFYVKKGSEWEMEPNGYSEYTNNYKIEIKPTVGDDYPTVLRQIRQLGCNILFLGEYKGVGIDCEKFVKLFSTQNIRVVFLSDIK